jgi:hypothetical protein
MCSSIATRQTTLGNTLSILTRYAIAARRADTAADCLSEKSPPLAPTPPHF